MSDDHTTQQDNFSKLPPHLQRLAKGLNTLKFESRSGSGSSIRSASRTGLEEANGSKSGMPQSTESPTSIKEKLNLLSKERLNGTSSEILNESSIETYDGKFSRSVSHNEETISAQSKSLSRSPFLNSSADPLIVNTRSFREDNQSLDSARYEINEDRNLPGRQYLSRVSTPSKSLGRYGSRSAHTVPAQTNFSISPLRTPSKTPVRDTDSGRTITPLARHRLQTTRLDSPITSRNNEADNNTPGKEDDVVFNSSASRFGFNAASSNPNNHTRTYSNASRNSKQDYQEINGSESFETTIGPEQQDESSNQENNLQTPGGRNSPMLSNATNNASTNKEMEDLDADSSRVAILQKELKQVKQFNGVLERVINSLDVTETNFEVSLFCFHFHFVSIEFF